MLTLLPEPADLVKEMLSTDVATRLRAVQQVERLGADGSPDEVYLAPLAALLRDPDPQTRGLAALGLWRHVVAIKGRVPEGVVGPLLLGRRDGNWYVAAYCERVFLALSERALPQLRAATEAGQPRALRLAALEGGARLLGSPVCREAVEAICWARLSDADAEVRERALVLLKSLQADYNRPPFRDAGSLAAALRVADDRIRSLAFQQLAALEDDAFPILADLLNNKSGPPPAQVVQLLRRLLLDGWVPDAEQTRLLLRGLDRTAGREAEETRETLLRITRTQASTATALEANLFSADPLIQASAINLLWSLYTGRVRPTPRALERLAEILRANRRTETTRAAAFLLRYTLRPTLQVPVELLDALRASITGGDDLLRHDCSFALAACGKQAEETLVALLQDKDVEVQYATARAVSAMVDLHRIALDRTEPHLKRLLNSRDPHVRRAARDALDALLRGGKP
jgi:hypothetical protein